MEYLETILLILLGINSIVDIRKKRISPISILLAAVAVILGIIYGKVKWDKRMLLGGIIGISFILSTIFLKVKIGMGDGILITFLGVCTGFFDAFMMVLYGLFFAAVIGIMIIVVKNKNGKYEIPFVPFLFLGYCMELLL